MVGLLHVLPVSCRSRLMTIDAKREDAALVFQQHSKRLEIARSASAEATVVLSSSSAAAERRFAQLIAKAHDANQPASWSHLVVFPSGNFRAHSHVMPR